MYSVFPATNCWKSAHVHKEKGEIERKGGEGRGVGGDFIQCTNNLTW